MKFLIIQTAFIGDVVLATGLVEKLHARFPEAQIDFLLRKGNEGLLTEHPFIHEVLVWDKKKQKNRNLFRMLRRIRQARYDKVINVQRFAATGLLTAFSKAKEKIGFDKNPFSWGFDIKVRHLVNDGGHEIERNDELITHFAPGRAYKPVLYPTAGDIQRVRTYQEGRYICIAPGSVWYTKQYPAEKWLSLIRKLPAVDKVYLLGGPAEYNLCETLSTAPTRNTIINLCGKLNFLASAAIMKGALMNYVNDSAPMHFASAVNAPVTAVYCSTIPAFGFGPLSRNSYIIEIPRPLECRPCGLHGHDRCPRGHFKCAHEIRDQQLLDVLPLDEYQG